MHPHIQYVCVPCPTLSLLWEKLVFGFCVFTSCVKMHFFYFTCVGLSVCFSTAAVDDPPSCNSPDLVNMRLRVFVCGSDRVLYSHAVLSRL